MVKPVRFNSFPSLVKVRSFATTLGFRSLACTFLGFFNVAVTPDKSNATIVTVFLIPVDALSDVGSKLTSASLVEAKLPEAFNFLPSNVTVNPFLPVVLASTVTFLI